MTSLELPPTTDSVSSARRHVREHLRDTGIDVETVELLVSELVTNAVLHARSGVVVRIEVLSDAVRVEVGDGSARKPRLSPNSAEAATGRGLRLVDMLSRGWGVEHDARGKTVWFEVGAGSAPRPGVEFGGWGEGLTGEV